MRGRFWALGLTALAAVGCGQVKGPSWYRGGFDKALKEAAERQTLVMVDFYTDWCTWCRRLEAETLSAPEVREELSRLVAMKVNAEKGGKKLAERFGVDSYPTIVFVDARGQEVDRIPGYLPPDQFVTAARRIRTGDTFAACLARLEADPSDRDALERSVKGLLDRSDVDGAIARLEAAHVGSGDRDGICQQLMFRARSVLHTRLYDRVAKLREKAWDGELEVPDAARADGLRAALASGLKSLPDTEQLAALRQARYEDAGALIEGLDLEQLAPALELDVAGFAFANGHYEAAASLYESWFRRQGAEADPDGLNRAAWNLYLARLKPDLALTMARQAHAADPSADIGDTLAHLLYVSGATDEALRLQERAAAEVNGDAGEDYRKALEMMRAGKVLDDRPEF
jgi:thiol-disulfide isomerase/thioredoxin